jgi:hypothetical protein
VFARARDDARFRALMLEFQSLRASIESLLEDQDITQEQVVRLIPRIHSVVKRFSESSGIRMYVFLDDLHYLPRNNQPQFLDILHSCVRDSDVWLKVAAVRHFAKWYQINPPIGLQAGQDAVAIDLDLTLQDPARAKTFLEKVLKGFANHVGIETLTSLYAKDALDRLVLASGAVPRDYLVLAANALEHARERSGARVAGRQDVTRAAGDIAKTKIAELEDDSASEAGRNSTLLRALEELREFCLGKKKHTVFLVDFKDKEQHAVHYAIGAFSKYQRVRSSQIRRSIRSLRARFESVFR